MNVNNPDRHLIVNLKHMKTVTYIAGFLSVIFNLIVGCAVFEDIVESGILNGKITIGPLCPVETVPPQPQCKPTLETFKAWQLSVYSQNGTTKIMNLTPDSTGKFQLKLDVGKYKLDFEKPSSARVGSSNLPLNFEIQKADTTRLAVDIDTGIR